MTDYSKLAQDFLVEINKIRTNPKSYIPHLETMLKQFKGDVLYRPKEIPIQTNEGPSAVKEAIEFLKTQSPVDAFKEDAALTNAAQDHVNDIGPKGLTGHVGTDGSKVGDRVSRYGKWEKTVGENIDFGGKSGVECVISFVVDDGVSTRGHRKNVFNNAFKVIGIAAGVHKEYGICLVTPLAGGISNSTGISPTKLPAKASIKEEKISPIKDNKRQSEIDLAMSKLAKVSISKDKRESMIKENNQNTDNMFSDLSNSKNISSVSTRTSVKVVGGKRVSTTEKIFTDNKGRRITEIIEDSGDGNITKKIIASGDASANFDDLEKMMNLDDSKKVTRKSEIITTKTVMTECPDKRKQTVVTTKK